MWQSAIIVFREVFEISLVVSALMAGTRGLPGRVGYVLGGIGLGVLASLLVAFFTKEIAEAMQGLGQEIFNAVVLLLAAVMIGWTVIWMRRHGRAIAEHLHHVSRAVTKGEMPLYTLATIIMLAVLREGSEIVLFTYGALASGTPFFSVVSGALLGLGGGAAVGFILYFGLARISTRHLFAVTAWLLIFLAASMSAQAAQLLVEAGSLPDIIASVWDSSNLLSDASTAGQVLHALVGYYSQPSGMQLVFYVATLVILGLALRLFAPVHRPRHSS